MAKSFESYDMPCPKDGCDGTLKATYILTPGRYSGAPENCYPDEVDEHIEPCSECGADFDDFEGDEQATIIKLQTRVEDSGPDVDYPDEREPDWDGMARDHWESRNDGPTD